MAFKPNCEREHEAAAGRPSWLLPAQSTPCIHLEPLQHKQQQDSKASSTQGRIWLLSSHFACSCCSLYCSFSCSCWLRVLTRVFMAANAASKLLSKKHGSSPKALHQAGETKQGRPRPISRDAAGHGGGSAHRRIPRDACTAAGHAE